MATKGPKRNRSGGARLPDARVVLERVRDASEEEYLNAARALDHLDRGGSAIYTIGSFGPDTRPMVRVEREVGETRHRVSIAIGQRDPARGEDGAWVFYPEYVGSEAGQELAARMQRALPAYMGRKAEDARRGNKCVDLFHPDTVRARKAAAPLLGSLPLAALLQTELALFESPTAQIDDETVCFPYIKPAESRPAVFKHNPDTLIMAPIQDTLRVRCAGVVLAAGGRASRHISLAQRSPEDASRWLVNEAVVPAQHADTVLQLASLVADFVQIVPEPQVGRPAVFSTEYYAVTHNPAAQWAERV